VEGFVPTKTNEPNQADNAAQKRQTVEPVNQTPVPFEEQIPPLIMGVQRAVLDPGRTRPADVLALQRLAGNRAVSRLIQAKLTVGPPGDRYEREADRVAEQVLSMPDRTPAPGAQSSTAQRQEEEEELQTKPLLQRQEEEEELQTKPLIQRQEEEEELQTKPLVQRQEEEEELQTKPLIQRQEEEEELQTKPLIQRQEEEEELQTKPLIQRQEEEEELQTKPLIQRQEEEEELQTKPLPSLALRTGLQRQAGGFEAGPEIEGRLAASRGAGSPLPDEVRTFMEPRFGADFGGVRVHTGGDAADLSRSLSAQAFTHGQDIYLGGGRYDPGTTAGKRLLAHELTHVVQQTGPQLHRRPEAQAAKVAAGLQRTAAPKAVLKGDKPALRGGSPKIQRLAWQNTQWTDATQAYASEGGGVGVLFVKDNTPASPVVVKSGEEAAPEVALSSSLHKQLWGGGKGGEEGGEEWGISTPGARMVSEEEAAQMKSALGGKLVPNPEAEDTEWSLGRGQRLIDSLSGLGTLVFEFASGKDFMKVVKEPKHTRKRWFRRWKRTTRSSSPLFTMLKDAGYIRSLGKVTAIDIFMANWDRLTQLYNPENWKVDVVQKAIQLVDNVFMCMEFGFRHFVNKHLNLTGQQFFDSWKANHYAQQLIGGQYAAIAQNAVEKMVEGINKEVRDKDKPLVAKELDKLAPQMVAWFAEGVGQGKTALLAVMQNPEPLLAGLPPAVRNEVLESIRLRVVALGGTVGKGKKVGKLPTVGGRFAKLGAFKYV
jgi:hypothetical protein